MAIDTLEERGLGEADLRWGSPRHCYFPLFDFLRPLPLPWMCMVYLAMWTGERQRASGALSYFSLAVILITNRPLIT